MYILELATACYSYNIYKNSTSKKKLKKKKKREDKKKLSKMGKLCLMGQIIYTPIGSRC